MAKVKIPVVDRTVSTSDPGGSVATIVLGSVGIALLLTMLGIGRWIYDRGRAAAGVQGGENPVPGV